MPTGVRIDWSEYDQVLIDNVSKYNILEFTRKFLPYVSPSATAKRIKVLNLKPLKFEFSNEIKRRISDKVTNNYFDDKTDKLLLDNTKSMSIKELSKLTGFDKTAIWRRLKEINYIHDKNDIYNKHSAAVKLALSSPEVKRKLSIAAKGRVLSEDTKLKISKYMTGSGNHQYGIPRTKEEKEKFVNSYKLNGGADKFRTWLKSETGVKAIEKMRNKFRSSEFRRSASLRTHELILLGKVNIHSITKSGWHQSSKSGNVHYRSSYELAYYKKLDANNDVISYEVEPFLIEYQFENTIKYYKPDLLVKREFGNTIEEVKPLQLVNLPKNQAKFKYANDYAIRCGLEFKVITEKDIF
jgi:hypothetical protein